MTDKRSFFSQIFTSLMVFSLLVAICTAVFISTWPWEKNNPAWLPGFRLVATCGDTKESCGVPYSELTEALASKRVQSLEPTEAIGEIEEANNWLKWSKTNGLYEVKASSWYFQTVIRYKIEDNQPVLIAYQNVDVGKAFTYGMAVAIFMMIGLNLRRLRG